MSASAILKIGRSEILDMQTWVDPYLMTLFKESDKKRSNNPKKYFYSNSANVIKRRLDLLGFSEAKAKIDFDLSKRRLLKDIKERSLKNILRKTSYDDWMHEMIDILMHHIKPQYWFSPGESRTIETLKDFILYYDLDTFSYYNYPCSDIRYFYRVLLRGLNPKINFILDYSDLVAWGTYTPNEKLTEISARQFSEVYPSSEKIIILTEGSTDAFIIKESMKLLYPEFFEYYYFFDFHSTKSDGGAGRLVANVKSFISSGIKNRIIAIFDNDTAAYDSVRVLNSLQIPENIKIMHLPDVPWATNYPTVGPAGNTKMNVNKLAGSIELYLGKDVLRLGISKYVPIQWIGYIETMKKYQGVVLNKQKILNDFIEKLKICQKNKKHLHKYDWSGMKYIIRSITEQFS